MSGRIVHHLLGKVFGRWTVIRDADRDSSGAVIWLCRCECGTRKQVRGTGLRNGQSTSCGCRKREVAYESKLIHGRWYTPEYKAWAAMIQRCCNPNNSAYRNYGGRGIAVSESWRSFEAFFADMGIRPHANLTLDRINNEGNYEKNNCRWTDRYTQAANSRKIKPVTFAGKTQHIAAWAREWNISWDQAKKRIEKNARA